MTPTTIIALVMTACLALGFGAGYRLRGAEDARNVSPARSVTK